MEVELGCRLLIATQLALTIEFGFLLDLIDHDASALMLSVCVGSCGLKQCLLVVIPA